MRPLLLGLAATLIASAAAAATTVPLHQVRRIALNGSAADVVVGNAEIADVTVVDGRNVFITGRSPGVTMVVVLDAAGRTIFSDSVQVQMPVSPQPTVSMTRGRAVETIVCNPRCGGPGDYDSSAAEAVVTGARIPRSYAPPAALPAPVALPEGPAGASAVGTASPS